MASYRSIPGVYDLSTGPRAFQTYSDDCVLARRPELEVLSRSGSIFAQLGLTHGLRM